MISTTWKVAGCYRTYHKPDRFIQRGQMGRRYFMMGLHWDMAIGLRMSGLRAMMKMHATGRCWLLVVAGHGQKRYHSQYLGLRVAVGKPTESASRQGQVQRPTSPL